LRKFLFPVRNGFPIEKEQKTASSRREKFFRKWYQAGKIGGRFAKIAKMCPREEALNAQQFLGKMNNFRKSSLGKKFGHHLRSFKETAGLIFPGFFILKPPFAEIWKSKSMGFAKILGTLHRKTGRIRGGGFRVFDGSDILIKEKGLNSAV
jgi:hypothetical protein